MSGEEVPLPDTDSFWEVEGYRKTVRRVEDGLQQCGELMKLIQERAEIEKEYAKRLKAWTKKWNENFDKG
jgi:Fes/CIP4, and EFC/F-BAR homology domain